jgi:hypothetical protein
MLMRSWTMPTMMMGVGSSGAGGVQVERDHSPLPDVEAGLFDDFSFGGSSTSSGSTGGGVEGEVLSGGVDPMGDAGVADASTTPSTHASSSLYDGSPPLDVTGLPDMTHFEHHHPHQQQHQQPPHLGGMDGMGDLLDMSAYAMYADVEVDPIERSVGGMKGDGYFEGGGGYEV